MSVKYILRVHRDLRLIGYEPRLKVARDLESAKYKYRLSHLDLNTAVEAAKIISKNPIVSDVTIVRVEESSPLIYRNGEQHKS